jgi:hypothetical protein
MSDEVPIAAAVAQGPETGGWIIPPPEKPCIIPVAAFDSVRYLKRLLAICD